MKAFKNAILASLLMIPLTLAAQSTSVTATITDSDSFTWNNGSYQIQFVPNPANPGPYTWTGGTLVTLYQGSLDGSGVLTISLPSNSAISGPGTQWKFTICPNATGGGCFTATTVVTGGSQSLTALLSASAVGPRFSAAASTYGYGTIEVNTRPQPGWQFYNTTTNACSQWTGSAWGTCGSAATGNLSGTLTTGFYPIATGVNALGDGTIDFGISTPDTLTLMSNADSSSAISLNANSSVQMLAAGSVQALAAAIYELQISGDAHPIIDWAISNPDTLSLNAVHDENSEVQISANHEFGVDVASSGTGATFFGDISLSAGTTVDVESGEGITLNDGTEGEGPKAGNIVIDEGGSGFISTAADDIKSFFANTYLIQQDSTPVIDFGVTTASTLTLTPAAIALPNLPTTTKADVVGIDPSTGALTKQAAGGGGLFAPILSLPTLSGASLTTAWNQGGSYSQTNVPTGIVIKDTGTTGRYEGVLRAYPVGNFTLTALFSLAPYPITDFWTAGIVVAASTSGANLTFRVASNSTFGVDAYSWTAPGTSPTNIITATHIVQGSYLWIQLVDNGTTVVFNYSTDGENWYAAGSITKASFSGDFNLIGPFINPQGITVGTTLMSWSIQ